MAVIRNWILATIMRGKWAPNYLARWGFVQS